MSWHMIVIVAMILAALIFMQAQHYVFLEHDAQQKDLDCISLELEARLKEFDEYKKRVDSLTLRAGFKV